MNIYTIFSIVAFLISLFLSFFVYLEGIQNKTRRAIIFIILCAGIWCLFPFLAWVGWPEKSLFLTRLAYIAAIFTAPAFLNFGLTILGIERVSKEQRLIRVSFLVSTLIFLPFLFSGAFIRNVKKVNSYFSIAGGPLYIIFFLYFGIVCLYCFYKLHLGIKESSGYRKNQIRYVFVGFLLAFFSGLIHFSASFGFREFFPHDFLVVACMVTLIYSIIRYQLLDIKIAITRTSIFIAVYTIVLGLPFVAGGYLKGWLSAIFGTHWWTFPLGLMAVLATLGPFLYIFLERRAEEQLLKEQKNYQRTLRQASMGMTRIRDLRRLLELIAHIVTKSVGIAYVGIYLYDKENNEYVLQVSRDKGRESILKLSSDNPLTAWMVLKRQPLIYEEVKRLMEEIGSAAYKALEENMRLLTAEVVIPSFLEDKFMGFIVLGEKLSGQIYTADDLSVFQVLANQAALAIENAQFYDETKQMQEQIAHAEKMATIGTMADGLSHQINNRFYALSLIAEDTIDNIKCTDTSQCSPEIKKMLEEINYALGRIKQNVLQGGQVVRGILKYTRKGEEKFEPVTLDQMIDGTLEMVQYKIKLSEIDIIRNYDSSLLPKIKANLIQMQESYFNLIDNAYFATVERKTNLQEEGYRGKIEFSALVKEEGIIEIKITDNGMGIKQENMKKLWTPFFTTKVSSRQGTGLGLYVIKRIVEENHHGKVRIESEYGKGTTFFIELHIWQDEQEKDTKTENNT